MAQNPNTSNRDGGGTAAAAKPSFDRAVAGALFAGIVALSAGYAQYVAMHENSHDFENQAVIEQVKRQTVRVAPAVNEVSLKIDYDLVRQRAEELAASDKKAAELCSASLAAWSAVVGVGLLVEGVGVHKAKKEPAP